MEGQLIAHRGSNKLNREQLGLIPLPEGTDTYQPLAHHDIVKALLETLAFRHISVVRDEYEVSEDGMKMFGVLDLETTFEGCRFSIGVRNANDKSMRLAMTVGYRVFVCDNMAFHGDFTPGTMWKLGVQKRTKTPPVPPNGNVAVAGDHRLKV